MELKVEVAKKLASSGPIVKERVIDLLAQQELEKRTQAAAQMVTLITTAEKDLAKLSTPDNVLYDADGKPTVQSYTKGRLDQIAKARKRLNALDGAFSKALEKDDWGDLYKLASGKQPEEAEDTAPSA